MKQTYKITQLLIQLLSLSIATSQTRTGEKCALKNLEEGLCLPLKECAGAMQEIQEQKRPQTCGIEDENLIVCCSQKINQKCAEYSEQISHIKGPEIVGGTDAIIEEFPHMVALGFGNETNILWECGGALISDTFVLTAAHCLITRDLGDVKFAKMGSVTLNVSSNTNNDFTIIRRIPHPDYRPPSKYNDIALLELNKPVTFSRKIKPACLNANLTIEQDPEWTGNGLYATGWGSTNFGSPKSNILQKVKLEPFTNEECNRSYNSKSRKYIKGILEDIMMCAGSRVQEKDTCQGDSGGPIQVYQDNRRLHLVLGVTSFGKHCGVANLPGVYSRVAQFGPWIESIVWP